MKRPELRGKRGLLSHLPVLSSLQDLDPAPRRFLLFIVFNVVSWQCIIGPVIVLFARKIEMPPSWVGFLISFTPISMALVVITGLLVTHWGAKRVMFTGWMLRNLIACVVFVMPWAILHGGAQSAWYVLMASTLGFCLMRAVGAGGWLPWLHEVVPEDQRGAYFSCEAAVTQLLNIVVSFFQALMLNGSPGINRYLFVYGVGIAAGFLSLIWMYRVPGGRGAEGPVSLTADLACYRRALADRPFLAFVLSASLCYACMSWLGASSVLYMRDALGVSSRTIMAITAVGSVAIMATIRHWARFAEHSGSGPALALSLTGQALAALACLTLIPNTLWSRYALAPVIILASLFGSAFWMTTNRAMLGYVSTEDRVGYTNFWTLSTALALGCTPILVGLVIDHAGLWGFRLCFAIAGIGGLGCALLIRRVARDVPHPEHDPDARPLFSPRTVAQIASVTIGLHESNR